MLKRVVMFFLAVFPILDIYCLPFFPQISLGYLSMLLLIVLVALTSRKGVFAPPPKAYVFFWIYVALVGYIYGFGNYKWTAIFPGGITFCLWTFVFLFVLKQFDFTSFRKYYRIIFAICAVVLFIQEYLRITTGIRLIFLLPISLADGTNGALLYLIQAEADRSSTFFREPAHFAVYMLPLLGIELFSSNNNKPFNIWSIFILITLLVLRSGNGFVGAILLVAIRLISILKGSNSIRYVLLLIIVSPIVIWGLSQYMQSEAGESVNDRVENLGTDESSTSYDRLFRGFDFYSRLPLDKQIVGIPQDEITNYIASTGMLSVFNVNTYNDNEDTYLNGIQTILVYYGLIGLVLFLLIYMRYLSRNTVLGLSSVLVFLLLMFVGMNYLSYMMLVCTVLAITEKNNHSIKRKYNL